MAPIKFEDNLKEKLEHRRLQPSTEAWETLQNKLDNSEAKKSNRTLWWLGIAASFAGILFVVTVFFNNDEKQTIEPIIVDTEKANIPNKNEFNALNKSVQEVAVEEAKIKKAQPKSKVNAVHKIPVFKTQLKQQQDKLIKVDPKEVIAQTDIKVEETPIIKKTNEAKTLTYEELKLREVVAQIQALKKNNHTVSDADIDALLDQAQKEIALKRVYNESTKTVDADALLQDVEADLEQSFRDRVFKALKSGYQEVKTAVAERNN
jgi:predicted RNA-binding Zn ribbon-like protein